MFEERNFLVHPYIIAMTLLIAAISALFLGFTAAYLYTRIQSGVDSIQLPPLFFVNTFILIATSLILKSAMNCYKNDKTRSYQLHLIAALIVTIIFLCSQIFAWNQLYQQGLTIGNDTMSSYLYIISGIHFAHVIAGIPFLALFLQSSIRNMNEPVSVLIYFSDPDKKLKLRLLTIYWHYLDFLWIYLVLFFFINSLF